MSTRFFTSHLTAVKLVNAAMWFFWKMFGCILNAYDSYYKWKSNQQPITLKLKSLLLHMEAF